MNTSKKINVNYSSLVGLKAELLRKQTEVKNAKVNADVAPTQTKHKVKTKKSDTKKLKIEKEIVDVDDIKAHKKSKIMLEAKARLYENLKKSHSNRNENFLVDFENKPESEDEDESVHSENYEDVNSDPEDDWVEYEDCFGRTRKCLRRDLKKMQEKDEFVKHEVTKKSQVEVDKQEEDNRIEEMKFIPKEPEIEIMRRKWEEQMEKLTEKTNIHYQDVLFDEARAHGVGYYEFSQDEEMRAKQQANLNALRKETLQKQKEMQNLKEMKEKMEQNRLKAARIRQRIRAGLPPEPTEEELGEIKESGEKNAEAKPEVEEIAGPEEKNEIERKEETSLVEIENKIKAFGELLGKRGQWREMSQEEWVHKRRKDRIEEFSPAYQNFKSAGYLEGRKRNRRNDENRTSFDDNSSQNIAIDNLETEIKSSQTTVKELDTKESVAQPISVDNSPENNVRGTWTEVIMPEAKKKVKVEKSNIPHSETKGNFLLPPKINKVDTESSDSSDSDVIGPMPLYTQEPVYQTNVQKQISALPELSNIDFSKPPPNLRIGTGSGNLFTGPEQTIPTPVPPPSFVYPPAEYRLPDSGLLNLDIVPNLSSEIPANSSSNITDGQAAQRNLNEDKIAAGLKYLRATFEKQKHT